jgi:hypothetical protein
MNRRNNDEALCVGPNNRDNCRQSDRAGGQRSVATA